MCTEKKMGYRQEFPFQDEEQCPWCGSKEIESIGGHTFFCDNDDICDLGCSSCGRAWKERTDGFIKLEIGTPYEEASKIMQNDPELKHVVYSWQNKFDKQEKHRGFFKFKDNHSFEVFVDACYAGGAVYIGAIHR